MPNKRDPNQRLVAFPLDAELLEQLDAVRGEESRSAFIRRALADKLKRCGQNVPESRVRAPDRKGKGGRRKVDAE